MNLFFSWLIHIALIFINIYAHVAVQIIYEKRRNCGLVPDRFKVLIPSIIFSFALIELSVFNMYLPDEYKLTFLHLFLIYYAACYLTTASYFFIFTIFSFLTFFPHPFFHSLNATIAYCLFVLLTSLFVQRKQFQPVTMFFIINSFIGTLLIFHYFSYPPHSQSFLWIVVAFLCFSSFHFLFLSSTQFTLNVFLELKEALSQTNALFHNKQIGILHIDQNDIILEYNEVIVQMFGIGFNPSQWLGNNFFELAIGYKDSIVNKEQFLSDIHHIMMTHEETLNHTVFMLSGDVYERDFLPLYINNTYKGAYINFRKVTERIKTSEQLQKLNQELEKQSLTDELTGLFNRRKMDKDMVVLLEEHMKSKEPLSFILLDIDYFKKYNDYYGHFEGDICLHRVAKIIKDTMRKEVDFVYRYGGEEFAILLSNTKLSGAEAVSKRILENVLSRKIPHETSPLEHLTVSIGCATWIPTNSFLTPQLFIEQADQQLYLSKQNGRNTLTSITI